jgi:hypothetical protein
MRKKCERKVAQTYQDDMTLQKTKQTSDKAIKRKRVEE